MTLNALDVFKPWEAAHLARNTSVADWMEQNIYFGSDRPRPGRLTLDEWQRPILESMQHSRETVLMLFSQAGKSLLYNGLLGWLCETGKSGMLAFPTEPLRDRFIEDKFEPLLEDCARFDSLIERTAKGEIGKDFLHRKNGTAIPWATSGGQGQLQQWTAEFTLADEVDKFQRLAESNDPLAILRGRGRAFRDRARLIVTSTPTTEDTSLIDAHYRASCGYRRYGICPLCTELTLLVFDPQKPDRLTCQCCEKMLPFDAQPEILASGRWIADRPSLIGRIDGYHLNQFWDALTPWQDVLFDYDPERPRDFYVQQLAIPASNLAEEPLTEEELMSIFQPTPADWPQIAKVMMVDVQRRRSGELVYALWTIHNSMRAPNLVCRWQRTITRGTREWDAAFRELRQEYRTHKPSVMFVDAGDAHGCDVQELIRQVFPSELRSGRVRPVRGWAHIDSRLWGGQPFIKSEETLRTKEKNLKRPLEINSPSCKSRFLELIRQGRVVLPGELGVDYPAEIANQFGAEQLRSYVSTAGIEKMKWQKLPGRENEALDLGTYALASTAYLGAHYGERLEYGDVMAFVPGAG